MVGVFRPGGSFGRAEQIATLGFGNASRSLSSNGLFLGNPMAKPKAQADGSSENEQLVTGELEKPELLSSGIEDGDEKLPPFLGNQKSKLLQLRDSLLGSMTGVFAGYPLFARRRQRGIRVRNASGRRQ